MAHLNSEKATARKFLVGHEESRATFLWLLGRLVDGLSIRLRKNLFLHSAIKNIKRSLGRKFLAATAQKDVQYSPIYDGSLFNEFPNASFTLYPSLLTVPKCNRDSLAILTAIRISLEKYYRKSNGTGDRSFIALHKAPNSQGHDAVEVDRSNRISVIIPVFNNGLHLLSKALPSLMTNRLWGSMEVLLIDDGSDCSLTLTALNSLEREFENVRCLRTGATPSGTASRPRNLGLEKATGQLVTFLDPDNEISPGGYDHLTAIYDRHKTGGKGLDFVFGYQFKIGDLSSATGRHQALGSLLISGSARDFLVSRRYPVISTQASLINRDFLLRSNVRFIDGAVGQDTVFGWQLLLSSANAIYTSGVFVRYYSERVGSVTNQKSIDFLRRSLIRENYQVDLLRQWGLLEDFQVRKFQDYLRDVYLPTLRTIESKDYREGQRIINTIRGLYGV